jgi:hypothetical protein
MINSLSRELLKRRFSVLNKESINVLYDIMKKSYDFEKNGILEV